LLASCSARPTRAESEGESVFADHRNLLDVVLVAVELVVDADLDGAAAVAQELKPSSKLVSARRKKIF
jgi:hypothetical protein